MSDDVVFSNVRPETLAEVDEFLKNPDVTYTSWRVMDRNGQRYREVLLTGVDRAGMKVQIVFEHLHGNPEDREIKLVRACQHLFDIRQAE